jgi:hypothetical protein
LGLIEWQRYAKCDVIGLSDRWRSIRTKQQALAVAETAPLPPMQPKKLAAPASTNAQA